MNNQPLWNESTGGVVRAVHAQTIASGGDDRLPDYKAMQAQLDRIEAALTAILDYIYIRDGVAVG